MFKLKLIFLNRTFLKLVLILVFVFTGKSVTGQNLPNKVDSQGLRHGEWKEFYDNDTTKIRFEGSFNHGKEIGLFKFYEEGLKHPVATILFSPGTDTVQVKYLSQSSKVISEGKMFDKKRIGVWTYYHKGSNKPMTVENYQEGQLHGEKIVYYDNGTIAEKAFYDKGTLQGQRILYSEKGVVLEQLTYVNGELHGPAKFFNGRGELVSEGVYKNDKHHGIWKYYENGKLKEEKDFSAN